MASLTCEEMVTKYLGLLQGEFAVTPTEEGCFLSTPFIRPDGQGIEFEVRAISGGCISVSDMGDTLGYLYVNGLTLSRKLISDVRDISKNHGVSLVHNELSIRMDADSIGSGLHELIQATMSVTSLIHKRRSGSRVQFNDEVESLIIDSGVTYDVGYRVQGQRESHTIKFHVNSGKNLLVHPLSASKEPGARSWAERLSYRFSDIQKESSQWRPIAVLDDREERAEAWTAHALTPVKEYAVKWSEREGLQSMLQSNGSERING